MPKRASKQYAEDDYTTVRLPNDLVKEMDVLIGVKGFKSRGEIVKEAIRDLMSKYQVEKPQLPRFERINGDATGVLIYDRELKGNKAVHVSIKPNGIKCDFHDANDCEHVKYALELADVQDLIRKKRKEGWKLELPEE